VARGQGISVREEPVISITGAKLRRLIPAGAVTGVLAFSYFATVPTDAISSLAGYGNNCGVKGYGYHDHGKVCPNRPFPGKGEGLEKFLGGAGTTGGSNAKSEVEGVSIVTTDNDTVAAGGGVTLSLGKVHGHGNGHRHGKGRD
jgi:hypothetical protein